MKNLAIELGECQAEKERLENDIKKLIETVSEKDKIDKHYLLGCLEIILND